MITSESDQLVQQCVLVWGNQEVDNGAIFSSTPDRSFI
jgi:hypothetical protein